MPPGSMPFFSVFSGVAHGPHQSTPNFSNSSSVVAPLMNAHSSPIGFRQNDLMLRSVITGKPCARGNVMVCCMTVSALTPCRVWVSIPAPRMRSRTRRYSVEAGRWSYGRYSITRQLSGAPGPLAVSAAARRLPAAADGRDAPQRRTASGSRPYAAHKAADFGAQAGELIQMWALAISQGLKIKAMTQWISPYPTLSQINKQAAFRYFATSPSNPYVRKVIALLAKLG